MTSSILRFVTLRTGGGGGGVTAGGGSDATKVGMRHGVSIKDLLAQLRETCWSAGERTEIEQFFFFRIQVDEGVSGVGRIERIIHVASNDPFKERKREIKVLLSHPDWITTLAFSLDSPILSSRISATDFLLALVTLNYPMGHNLVTTAFNAFHDANVIAASDGGGRGGVEESDIGMRPYEKFVNTIAEIVDSRGVFGGVVGSNLNSLNSSSGGVVKSSAGGAKIISSNRDAIHQEVKEYLISAIALIRYLIQVPPQVEYRIHVRNDFTACRRFRATLAKIKTWAPSENSTILMHIKEFEDRDAMDYEEFMDAIMECGGGVVCEELGDMEDEHRVLSVLMECVGYVGGGYVRNILKRLLGLGKVADEVIRTKFMLLIDTVISQIVLDGKGFPADFFSTYRIPVEDIVRGFVEKDEFEELQKEFFKAKLELSEANAEKKKLQRQLDVSAHQDFEGRGSPKFSIIQDILKQKEAEVTEYVQKIERLKRKHDAFLKTLKEDLSQVLSEIQKPGILQKVDSATSIPDNIAGFTVSQPN
ncbi:hypothetical protein HK100_008536, partial [Physocladia obscura]